MHAIELCFTSHRAPRPWGTVNDGNSGPNIQTLCWWCWWHSASSVELLCTKHRTHMHTFTHTKTTHSKIHRGGLCVSVKNTEKHTSTCTHRSLVRFVWKYKGINSPFFSLQHGLRQTHTHMHKIWSSATNGEPWRQHVRYTEELIEILFLWHGQPLWSGKTRVLFYAALNTWNTLCTVFAVIFGFFKDHLKRSHIEPNILGQSIVWYFEFYMSEAKIGTVRLFPHSCAIYLMFGIRCNVHFEEGWLQKIIMLFICHM